MTTEEKKASPKRPKKAPVIIGVVAAIVVVAGAGLWVWHEQPSFCGAICHVPMDPYLETYEAEPGQAGTDKWGNEVTDAAAMTAAYHRAEADSSCLDCHTPVLSEQISEGINWVSGNYEVVLLTALPLTACACVRAAFRSIPEAALPHRLFPRFSYPWKLYVLMALYSFAYGLRQMQMVDGTGRGSTYATMIASAVVFASAWFFADRVVLIKASRAPMLFMVCGFLLVPAQSVMGDAVSSYLISISYTLMHVFTLVLLCSMARKSGVPAPLCAVQLLTMVGVGVDAGLGALGMSAVAQSTVSVVMVALLVALITLLLLSERRWDSHWTVVLDDDSLAEESSREGAVAARCDELSARCGLSPREDEIMRLLARKKTMAAIARDLYIAEGTVKAHVRHIYEKAGINTRKDLLELLGVGDR